MCCFTITLDKLMHAAKISENVDIELWYFIFIFMVMHLFVPTSYLKVKDILRNDPRYKSVKHEDREAIFNEYISELTEFDEEAERESKAKRAEEEKLKERERALRKRKEREEQEVERVRSKARRKEAIESYQALLVETIKDSQISWTDAKPKLEKDPQGRAANPHLDQSDL
ncbi:pre-mRNA-processing protein 40C isoform X1, partial [Tanacetum coccineum]